MSFNKSEPTSVYPSSSVNVLFMITTLTVSRWICLARQFSRGPLTELPNKLKCVRCVKMTENHQSSSQGSSNIHNQRLIGEKCHTWFPGCIASVWTCVKLVSAAHLQCIDAPHSFIVLSKDIQPVWRELKNSENQHQNWKSNQKLFIFIIHIPAFIVKDLSVHDPVRTTIQGHKPSCYGYYRLLFKGIKQLKDRNVFKE